MKTGLHNQLVEIERLWLFSYNINHKGPYKTNTSMLATVLDIWLNTTRAHKTHLRSTDKYTSDPSNSKIQLAQRSHNAIVWAYRTGMDSRSCYTLLGDLERLQILDIPSTIRGRLACAIIAFRLGNTLSVSNSTESMSVDKDDWESFQSL